MFLIRKTEKCTAHDTTKEGGECPKIDGQFKGGREDCKSADKNFQRMVKR